MGILSRHRRGLAAHSFVWSREGGDYQERPAGHEDNQKEDQGSLDWNTILLRLRYLRKRLPFHSGTLQPLNTMLCIDLALHHRLPRRTAADDSNTET